MSVETLPVILNVLSVALAGTAGVLVALGVRNVNRAGSTAAGTQSELHERLKGLLRVERARAAVPTVLKPRELVGDDHLSPAAAEIGVADLELILKALMAGSSSTPHLVGVNKGGSLVANFLAHRLDLHEKYLVKCDFRTDGYEKLYCEDRDIRGDIVVLDDVVRTGYTISRVKSYFSQKYPESKVFAICLVLVSDAQANAGLEDIVDYHAWYAGSKHVRMPWSNQSGAIVPSEFFDEHEIDQLVGHAVGLLPRPQREVK